MSKTYQSIVSQIKKLQQQADKLAKGRASAIVAVKRLIRTHDLTAEDIGLSAKRAAQKVRKHTKRVAPKYRGPGGETWSGRGLMPRWLRDVVKTGRKRDDFLIKKTAAGAK